MKTTMKDLKNIIGQVLEAGHVDRSKRKARGYGESDLDADYTDVAMENIEITEDPGVSQSKRLAHGYGLEEPADYDVPGEGLPKKEEDIMALRARMHTPPALKSMNPPPPVDVTDAEDEMDDEDMKEMCGSEDEELDEVTPPGFEKVVKGLKKNPEVDNPWAVAWSMKDKGAEPKKEHRMPSLTSVLFPKPRKKK